MLSDGASHFPRNGDYGPILFLARVGMGWMRYLRLEKSAPMKRITKEYTVWKEFWSEPKYIARDAIILLAIYGFVRGCMDIWSWPT